MKEYYTLTELRPVLYNDSALMTALGLPDCYGRATSKAKGRAKLWNGGRVEAFLENNKERIAELQAKALSAQQQQQKAIRRASQKQRWATKHEEVKQAVEEVELKFLLLPKKKPDDMSMRQVIRTYTNFDSIVRKYNLLKVSKEARFILINRFKKVLCEKYNVAFVPDVPVEHYQPPRCDSTFLGIDPLTGRSIFTRKSFRGVRISDIRTTVDIVNPGAAGRDIDLSGLTNDSVQQNQSVIDVSSITLAMASDLLRKERSFLRDNRDERGYLPLQGCAGDEVRLSSATDS